MSERLERAAQVTFRRLVDEDVSILKTWLEDPDVSPWYESDSNDIEALEGV